MIDTIRSPLSLRGLDLPHRLIQAPLAGYSGSAFRQLIQKYSGPTLTFTEMLPAHLVQSTRFMNRRFLERHETEPYLGYQIAGCDANLLSEAASFLTDFGADAIDLNLGCPQRKIRKKGWGSALLDDPEHLYQILQAVRAATDRPLSIKIRLHGEKINQEVLSAAIASQCDWIFVHGRTWKDRYEAPCQYQSIAQLAKQSTIPLIGNGDLLTADDLPHWQDLGVSGMMVGRGSIGAPWRIGQMLGTFDQKITPSFVAHVFKEHLMLLSQSYSERAVLFKMRSLLPAYSAPLNQRIDASGFYACPTLNACLHHIDDHFRDL